jgi:hypothetical protein
MAIIPPAEILSLKKSQLFIEFSCIWASNLKLVESCKSVFFKNNIHISTHFVALWTVPPEVAAPLTLP